MKIKIPSGRLIAAGAIAVTADILQYVLLPMGTIFGIADPTGVDQILDIAVAGIMVSLLGFHWVFIPSAIGKMVPVADMMPFWSGAVFFVAMGQAGLPAGQTGNPLQNAFPGVNTNPLNPAQSTLPATAPSSAQPTDAQALHPFFREIDSK